MTLFKKVKVSGELGQLQLQVAARFNHEGFLFDNDGEALVVRAKRATTAGRQARAGENVPRTAYRQPGPGGLPLALR